MSWDTIFLLANYWAFAGWIALAFLPRSPKILAAILYAGVWFLIQIVEGWASLGADPMSGGIAWWAHIGGFAAGLALAIAFVARPSAVRGPWQR